VGLLDVVLRDPDGSDVRVPHLYSLLKPMRLHASEPRLVIEVCVQSDASLPAVQRLLESAAVGFADHAHVDLIDIDADGARYAVSVAADTSRASELRLLLAETLVREKIGWGRRRSGGGAS